MAERDAFVCIFCSSDIGAREDTTTVPNLGILVHTSCYDREMAGRAPDDESAVA